MNEFLDMFNKETDGEEQKDTKTELDQKEVYEIMQRFSGLDENGVPKATVSYCSYNADAPDEEIAQSPVYLAEEAMVELSMDWKTGFYTLDLIFNDPDNRFLKMMWANMQKHKSNEVYDGEKLWVFFINLIENNSIVKEDGSSDIFMANIINPVLFFLTRQVPNQDVFVEYEDEGNVFYGGNCIRMLLHKDLVTFKYIPSEELIEEEQNQ